MYSQGASVLRADLNGLVEEALNTESTFIGTRLMPPMPVVAKAGQYPVLKINAGKMLRGEVRRRGPTSTYARTEGAWEYDTYSCFEYGLERLVGDVDQADVGRFFDLEATTSKLVQRQLLLAHERRVAAKMFSTSNFSLTTSATAYTTTNLTSFDIAFDVDLAKLEISKRGESTAVSDLVAVMSEALYLRARQSTRLQNRIRGTASTDSTLSLDPAAMAEALGVREVLIGRNAYDTTLQGASASSLSSIWSDSYLWIGKAAAGDYFSGGAGRTLFWQEDGSIIRVESYREEQNRSTVIRVRHTTDEKIINANAGQLLVTQMS
jgi:hypothetical protein